MYDATKFCGSRQWPAVLDPTLQRRSDLELQVLTGLEMVLLRQAAEQFAVNAVLFGRVVK